MAIEYGWTGWDNGEADACISPSPVRGRIVGVNRLPPRTGQNFFSYHTGDSVTNSWASYARKNTTLGVGTASATTIARVFFRLQGNPSTNNCGCLCVGTPSSGGQQGNLSITTARNFKVWAHNRFSADSAAVLDLDTWYRADITHVITQSGGNVLISTSCSVYEEDGTFIETVSQTQNGVVAGTVNLPTDVACGNGTAFSSTANEDFDDLWWGSADGADQASLAFPTTAWRVTRVPVLAQGSVAQWTGDFRTVIDNPLQTATTDEQTNAVATQQTLFTKDTAAALGIGNIDGVIVAAQLRTTGASGNESLMLGGVAYTVPVTGSFGQPRKTGVNYNPGGISQATFDGWEFGARNDRGTSLRLANCYLDVLHDGPGTTDPLFDVQDTFRLNIITYTGNGGYQTITGMGFAAQVIIVLGVASTLAAGFMHFARSGGTRGIATGSGAQDTNNGILFTNNDGFVVGPNNNCNQNGITYLAIGLRDGGQGTGGFHLSTMSRCGFNLDNANIIFRDPFTPNIAWNQNPSASGGTIIKTDVMVGDLAVGFSGGSISTNNIQALNSDGYQVGNAAGVNGIGTYNLGMIIKTGVETASFIHYGTQTAGGTTATVSGLPFTPVFVMVQRRGNAVQGHWRSSLTHAAATSAPWNGGLNVANGITSITADGFTIGSLFASVGVNFDWIALGPGSLPQGGCVVNLASGADAGGIAGCRDTFGNGVDSGGIAGCRMSLAS